MTERRYGRTESGKVITDADIEQHAAEAEAGYDVDELLRRRGKRGRPALGSGRASAFGVADVAATDDDRRDLVEPDVPLDDRARGGHADPA